MSLVFAALLLVQADTVRLPSDTMLSRVLTRAPGVSAALLRSDAATARAAQARAFTNPGLSVNVDNLGAEEEVTNISGWRGVEGQAVLTFDVPLGGDRRARIAAADAGRQGAEAQARLAVADAVVQAVDAVAAARRDERLARQASTEVATLVELSTALRAQSAAGRASEGDAARARLALSVARERLARHEAQATESRARVALMVGEPPDTPLQVVGGSCPVPAATPGALPPPEIALAEARNAGGAANLDRALAGRIPDLSPEVGLRRTMGVEALYAGFSVGLPLFDRQSRAVDAARSEARAADAEARDVRRQLAADRAAADAAFDAHSDAGSHFTAPGWAADLERAVESVEARWQLGEGTLMGLLDGRRARLEALAARERWAAAWLVARARARRYGGAEPTPDLFCEPLRRQTP